MKPLEYILNDLKQSGAKTPAIVNLTDDTSFPAVFTGFNVNNNLQAVTLIDTNTGDTKTIPVANIREIATSN